MIEFISDPNNVLFTAALILTVAAFSFETLGFVVAGIDLFGMLDTMLPDIDADFDDGPVFYQLLGWAKHKNVPFAIWAVMLTGIFGMLGLILQTYMNDQYGYTLRALYAVPACLIPTLLVTSYVTKGLGEHVFVDSSVAVTKESLIGCQGYITIGRASTERSAEASIKDRHGKTHLIMCRADNGVLNKNDIVKIVQIIGDSAVAQLSQN